MTTVLLLAASAIAMVAALRSTWSPCGVSMLSTITPVTERAKGHRYGTTAAAFAVGAVLGGLCLGLGAAALAGLVGLVGLTGTQAVATLAALAAVTAAADARLGGFALPGTTRQVNELWFGRYRAWVYASGFGWQIGVGLATFLTTAAVYLTIAAAALTGEPVVALALGTLFGTVRGLVVFAGWRLRDMAALMAFHRRFDALDQPTRWATVAAQLAVGAVLAATVWGPVVAVVGAGALGAAVAVAGQRRPSGLSLPMASTDAGTPA